MKTELNKNLIYGVICVLIAVGLLGRLLPHLPNATPITALAVVASIYVGRKTALFLPLGVLLLTDLIIGFYSIGIMASVYGSFLLIAILSQFLKKKHDFLAVLFTLLGASLSFFFITNTAVWWFSPWYEKSFAGLLYSYQMGLPFLKNMFLGDMVYTYTLLSVFALAQLLIPATKKLYQYTQNNFVTLRK